MSAQKLLTTLDDFKKCLSPADQTALAQAGAPTATSVTEFTSKLNEVKSKKIKEMVRRVEPFLRAVQRFSSAVDVMVQGSGIASLVWGSVRIVMTLSFSYLDRVEKLSVMFCQLGNLCPIYDRFAELFSRSPELRDALCVFYAIVIDFCKDVVMFLQNSAGSRMQILSKPWKRLKIDFQDAERALGTQKEVIDLEITYASEVLQADSRQKAITYQSQSLQHLVQVRDWQLKKDDEAHALRWKLLLAQVCDYDHVAALQDCRKRRTAETGKWLMRTSEFQAWSSSQTSCGLWCHGIPGAGKSLLMATLIDHLVNSMPPIIAYFFCTFSNQESLNARTVITSLTKQVLAILGPNDVENDVRRHFQRTSGPPDLEECEVFLADMITRSRSTTYILVDGLDECSDHEKTKVIACLSRLSKSSRSVIKCYLSSRPEHEYPEALEDFHVVKLTAEKNSEDIKLFIAAEIQRRKRRGSLYGFSDELLTLVADTLASKAEAMFLLVFYQLEEIFRENDDASILELLHHLPGRLHDVFERILSRIAKERNDRTAKELFKWIICAKRPLIIDELAEGISIKIGNRSFSSISRPFDNIRMIQNCGPLIVYHPDGTVTLAHYTVKQFLTSAAGSFTVDEQSGNLDLGRVCLTYLNFTEFDTALAVPEPTKKDCPPPQYLKINFSAPGFAPLLFQSKSRVGWLWSYLAQTRVKQKATTNINLPNLLLPTEPADKEMILQDAFGAYKVIFHLLEYAAKNWLFHCSHMTANDPSWPFFSATVEGPSKPFPYLPWQSDYLRLPRVPDFPPKIQEFFWAVRNNIRSLMRYILSGRFDKIPAYFTYELDGVKAGEAASASGNLDSVIQVIGLLGRTSEISFLGDQKCVKRLTAAALRARRPPASCLLGFCQTKTITEDNRAYLLSLAARHRMNQEFEALLLNHQGLLCLERNFQHLLSAAARGGNVMVVNRLLLLLEEGKTPRLEPVTADSLHHRGCEVECGEDWCGLNPLQAACVADDTVALDLAGIISRKNHFYEALAYRLALISALETTAQQGNKVLFLLLLSKFDEVYPRGVYRWKHNPWGSLIAAAADGGSVQILDLAMERYKAGYYSRPEGYPRLSRLGQALLAGARKGHHGVVVDVMRSFSALEMAKPEPHEVSNWVGLALTEAIEGNKKRTVEYLLRLQSQLPMPTKSLRTGCYYQALQAAAAMGSLKLIERLQSCFQTTITEVFQHEALLGLAAEGGHVPMIAYLLSKNCQPDQTVSENTFKQHRDEEYGFRYSYKEAETKYPYALMAAAKGGRLEAVRLLLNAGASVGLIDPRGPLRKTAVSYALEQGHSQIFHLLLDIAPDAVGEFSRSDFVRNNNAEMMRTVRKIPAINTSGFHEQLLQYAARDGNLEVVEALLDYGYTGHQALRLALNAASDGGYLAVTKLLLRRAELVELHELRDLADERKHPLIGWAWRNMDIRLPDRFAHVALDSDGYWRD